MHCYSEDLAVVIRCKSSYLLVHLKFHFVFIHLAHRCDSLKNERDEYAMLLRYVAGRGARSKVGVLHLYRAAQAPSQTSWSGGCGECRVGSWGKDNNYELLHIFSAILSSDDWT